MPTTATADETSDFESTAVRQAREASRRGLSQQLGRLLEQLRQKTPPERLAWYQSRPSGPAGSIR